MRRVSLATLLAILLVFGASAGAALAAPVNSPKAEFFTVTCDNGETYDIVVSAGNVAHILGTTDRLVPHHFTFTLVVNSEELFSESEGTGKGNKTGLKVRLMTFELEFPLTIDDFTEEEIEFLESEGIDLETATFVAHITVEVMKTPAKR
jgi:hypothetical protein